MPIDNTRPSPQHRHIMKMIRGIFAGLFALLLTFTLTGCFQAEQVINVKPDGSGTVVLTVKMSKEALEQMKAFGGADAKDKDPLDDMMKPEETDKIAKKLGEGVTFVKAEKVTEEKFAGKRVTFKFDDINKLKADMNIGPDANADEAKEPLKFTFTKGSPATLVIQTPVKEKKEDKPEDPNEDAQMAAAAPMMKDARMTIAVNVEGTIVSTDAENKDGTRITILDLPVGEALKDVKRFKAIDKASDWSAAAKLMKEIPGVKVESKNSIKVQLK